MPSATYEPDLKGYVTRIASPAEIDVNGVHIRIDNGTQFFTKAANKLSRTQAADAKPYIGQTVEVYGKRHGKEHAIEAKQINLHRNQARKVRGSGIVDAIPHTLPFVSPQEGIVLRADGYLVLVTKQTEQIFQPPITAADAHQTNVWVSFHGTQRADGVVVATSVSFRLNTVDVSPVPLNEIVCWPLEALSKIVKTPVRVPFAVGLNLILIAQKTHRAATAETANFPRLVFNLSAPPGADVS
ncbi:MAG: hypothetical protein CXZ00_14310 [Acidobacteria bacterium]|nr:MAG: hypothetical protein CXZ00_14310 [Acidobacteriota bacterium]